MSNMYQEKNNTEPLHIEAHVITQTATMSTPLSSECRLLALPAELRNKIYKEALVEDRWIIVHKEPSHLVELKFGWPGRCYDSLPNLTRTNHSIRAETLPVFFEFNKFCFYIGSRPQPIILPMLFEQYMHKIQDITLVATGHLVSLTFRLDLSKCAFDYTIDQQQQRCWGEICGEMTECGQKILARATELLADICTVARSEGAASVFDIVSFRKLAQMIQYEYEAAAKDYA